MNPFVWGRPVEGKDFIGRQDIVEDIESEIFGDSELTNIAIIGVNHIGTTSLAHEKIYRRREELIIEKGVIPIWISPVSYKQSSSFLNLLVTQCASEVKQLDLLSDQSKVEEIQTLADKVSEALKPDQWENPWFAISSFFRAVKATGYRTLFILDRFDKTRHLFVEGDKDFFDVLRQLAYEPDYGVKLILTSRLNIEVIQSQAGSLSEFHSIFLPKRLGMFSDADLEDYFLRFSPIGFNPDAIRDRVSFYCGAHPYLLQRLGWHIVERLRDSTETAIDIDETLDLILEHIFFYYDRLTKLLEDAGLLDKLLQILFNNLSNVPGKGKDENSLEGYGLIKQTASGYEAYSKHFHAYLSQLYERSEFAPELWPIWWKTERALREVITTTMSKAYGDSWTTALGDQYPILSTVFNRRCQKRQQDAEKKYGTAATRNLIDFTYPADLFDIICDDNLWTHRFQPIFGEDGAYWHIRKEFIAQCRTRLSHSQNFLDAETLETFAAYCKEILKVYENWATNT